MANNRSATLAGLRETLDGLPALVQALPRERVDTPHAVGEWSARDVVVHLADAEQVYGVRVRMLVTQERPFLAAFDQDAWARRFAGLETLDEGLGRWVVLRRANLALFESLNDEEWLRPGDHEEGMKVGRVETPERVADTLDRHTRDHMVQMRAVAAPNRE